MKHEKPRSWTEGLSSEQVSMIMHRWMEQHPAATGWDLRQKEWHFFISGEGAGERARLLLTSHYKTIIKAWHVKNKEVT